MLYNMSYLLGKVNLFKGWEGRVCGRLCILMQNALFTLLPNINRLL